MLSRCDIRLNRLERLRPRRLSAYIFLLGFIPRILLVAFWQIRRPNGVFPDETSYISQAAEIARGTLSTAESNFWSSNWAFFRPLVFFAELTDHHALLGRLTMAAVGSLLAVVVFLLGRHISIRTGWIAGLIVALYPSQVLWSSMFLKDTLSAFLLATVSLIVAHALRRRDLPSGVVGPILVALLVIIASGVRVFSAVSVVLALFLTFAWRVARQAGRRQIIGGGVLLITTAATVLLLVGDRIPFGGTGGNELLRQREYEDAKTLISCDPIPFIPGPEAYESGWLNDLACSPYALRMVLFDPFPNQLSKSRSLVPPFAENLLWWPLLGLAAVAVRKVRHHQEILALPMVLGAGLVLQWSLIDRVFGTAFRHRTEFVWIIALLAAVSLGRLTGDEATSISPDTEPPMTPK